MSWEEFELMMSWIPHLGISLSCDFSRSEAHSWLPWEMSGYIFKQVSFQSCRLLQCSVSALLKIWGKHELLQEVFLLMNPSVCFHSFVCFSIVCHPCQRGSHYLLMDLAGMAGIVALFFPPLSVLSHVISLQDRGGR